MVVRLNFMIVSDFPSLSDPFPQPWNALDGFNTSSFSQEYLTIQDATLKSYAQLSSPVFNNFKQHEENGSTIRLLNAVFHDTQCIIEENNKKIAWLVLQKEN